MSDEWSRGATLGEVIDRLLQLDRGMVIEDGFGDPHSWRGDYAQLAFRPKKGATVAEMLAAAKSAIGETYEGWKGGEYTMGLETPCHLAEGGEIGVPILVTKGLPYVLPIPPKRK